MCFYWNEIFDFILMNILKDNWDSPLEYVVSLFNTFCNTNNNQIIIIIILNTYFFFIKTTEMFLSIKLCLIFSLQDSLP
jgi:hypothetical protein